MTCGPAPYMEKVEQEVAALGVTRFFKEKFFTPVAEAATSGLKFTKLQPARVLRAGGHHPARGAGEQSGAGDRRLPRRRLRLLQNQSRFREYSVTSTMTLTEDEIADGYVLACSCRPQSDLVLA